MSWILCNLCLLCLRVAERGDTSCCACLIWLCCSAAGERALERAGERAIERVGERALERAGEQGLSKLPDRGLCCCILQHVVCTSSGLSLIGIYETARTSSCCAVLLCCCAAGERALERAGERAIERVGERAMERVGERALERAGGCALQSSISSNGSVRIALAECFSCVLCSVDGATVIKAYRDA
jgi:hypothetical protein